MKSSNEDESAGNAKPRSVKSPDTAAKKSEPVPVVVASDPADPAPVLKMAEAPHETVETSQSALVVEAFALPELAPSNDEAAPSTPVALSTGVAQSDAPAPSDPGTLVFQLSCNVPLNGVDASAKAQPENKANQPEIPSFSAPEEVATHSETRAGGSNTEGKNQEQAEQAAPVPQPRPASDGTIASQFGFQAPLAFIAQTPAAKTEATAPTRAVENVSAPEMPAAPAVDRIALTIHGENDQVVRVQVNQSGELVQVGVNTANAELASDLRGSVPELVRRLDQQGYETKISMPSTPGLSAPVSIAAAHSEFRSGADTNGDSRNFVTRDEPRQQRQRNNQRAWRELASQLQDE